MKQIMLMLTVFFISAAMLVSVYAESQSDEDLQEIVALTGIMTYDGNGAFNGDQSVTRGAMAKIVVALSGDDGLVSINSRISPFADVSYKHWAAPYIQVATQEGYMTSYMNGRFEPDAPVTYEVAVTAMLMALGYERSDFLTGYPTAQLSQAKESGLLYDVKGSIGQGMTRTQMARLVYNTLNAETKDGSGEVQAEVLDYTISTDILSLSDVLSEAAVGPVTYKTSNQLVGINLTTSSIYLDGKKATVSSLEPYDVVYYSETSQTVWAYSEKVTGLLEEVEPNRETPTSVTISGEDYSLETIAAQKAFGVGGLEEGDMVTLLLDRSGDVADGYLTETLYSSQVGVVIDTDVKTYEVGNGRTTTELFVSLLLPSGQTIEVNVDSDPSDKLGDVAKVDYEGGSIDVSYTSNTSAIEGLVSKSTASIIDGSSRYALAPAVKILEVDDYGNVVTLTLSRLDGVVLEDGQVLTVTYNDLSEIEEMIIKDVTRDSASYGYVTEVEEKSSGLSMTSSYSYDIEGSTSTLKLSNKSLNISVAPSVFNFEEGSLETVSNLYRVSADIEAINPLFVTDEEGTTYKLSSEVAVYKEINDTYIYTSLSEAQGWSGTVVAYYDRSEVKGGLVRILYLK